MSQIDDKRINDRELLNHFTEGMWLDSLPSLQPKGTYREAWSVTNVTENEANFGISNESSNELCVDLPDGYSVRGLAYAEERNQYVVMLYDGSSSEIGIIEEDTKSYRKVCNTSALGFSGCEWIHMELKIMQPCNMLHVYWSTNDVYKGLNLDDPCCKCEEFELLRCHDVGVIQAECIGGLGNSGGLPNGVYMFAIRLVDEDGNKTNFFRVSKPVDVGQTELGDNLPGGRSGQGINIRVQGLHEDYPLVEIAVISIIDNVTSSRLVDVTGHGNSVFNYTYYGNTGKEFDIPISEILDRKNMYLKGKSLAQHDGHLILYNTISQFDLDYQEMMEEVEWGYTLWEVPETVAHKYKGLRPNEKYLFGLRANYCDGTSSRTFVGYGPEGPEYSCEYPADDSTIEDCDIKMSTGDYKVALIENDSQTDEPDMDLVYNEETGEWVNEDTVYEEVDIVQEAENAQEEAEEIAQSGSNIDTETQCCMCELLKEILLDVIEAGDRVEETQGSFNVEDIEVSITTSTEFDDQGNPTGNFNTNGVIGEGGISGTFQSTNNVKGSTHGERFIGLSNTEMFRLACECAQLEVCQPNPDFDEELYQNDPEYDVPRCIGTFKPFEDMTTIYRNAVLSGLQEFETCPVV